jgi:hypothetical protein
MRYMVQSTVTLRDKWRTVYSVPTFYLDSRVQGIVDVHHASTIAREVIDPAGLLDVNTVVTTVYE